MRRARLARDASARQQVEAMIAEGRSIREITSGLGAGGHTRSAVGRYVRAYQHLAAEIAAAQEGVLPAADGRSPPTSRAHLLGHAKSAVHAARGRDTNRAEAELRNNLPPVRQRGGVDDATISLIKRELLGIRDDDKAP